MQLHIYVDQHWKQQLGGLDKPAGLIVVWTNIIIIVISTNSKTMTLSGVGSSLLDSCLISINI